MGAAAGDLGLGAAESTASFEFEPGRAAIGGRLANFTFGEMRGGKLTWRWVGENRPGDFLFASGPVLETEG
jgi:hypothetical protein